jgi:hypothetical protein
MSREAVNAKKRGRPEVDSEAVTVRLPRDLLTVIDAWREEQTIAPKRPDVLRLALVEWAKGKGIWK